MKFTITEFDLMMNIDLEAETAADAAIIARIKMNSLAVAPRIWAEARQSGIFTGTIQLPKAKTQTSYIEPK